MHAIPACRRGRLALVVLVVLACEVPRDAEGTLARAQGGTLRVGAVEAPPLLERRGEIASGPEADLVRAFAEEIGARIEWQWRPLDEQMRALEAFELDLVAAGLTAESPWRSHVGFTRPWREEEDVRRVLAVAPGENATLVALERVIVARRTRS